MAKPVHSHARSGRKPKGAPKNPEVKVGGDGEVVDVNDVDLSSLSEEEHYRMMRNLVFTPCQTKKALRAWISTFLDLEIPDGFIYNHINPSTSSPMDMIWEIYHMMLSGNKEIYAPKVLAYASRDSFKTLGASVLEVLVLLHLGCSVAHMAAIKAQSEKAVSYCINFLSRPYIRDFIVGSNDTKKTVARYVHKTSGDSINTEEYNALPRTKQTLYEYREAYIRIIIATTSGANCVDVGSLIDTPQGKKKALDLRSGDDIISLDLSSGEKVVQKVKDVVFRDDKQCMRIHFSDGSSVVATEDHPIFTEFGWVKARALQIGDRCGGELDTSTKDEALVPFPTHPIHNPWSVLLGSLMGDASMTWPKNKQKQEYGKGPRWAVDHRNDKKQYLTVKAAALEACGEKAAWVKSGENKTKVSSGVSGAFSELYRELYPNGKKTITRQFLERLDEEALAYWFMDDARGNAEVVGSYKDHCFELATCGFSIEENKTIQLWFDEKFQVKPEISFVSNQSGNKYPFLKFSLDDSRKLAQIMDRYFVPCMRYKLPTTNFLLESRCIECGTVIPRFTRRGFSRCPDCQKELSPTEREKQRNLKNVCQKTVSKKEFLGERPVVDIVVDTDSEHRKNFICNDVVVHNSEHVPFLVVDEVDLITQKEKAYNEAMMIPSEHRGIAPVVLLTSTRKYSFGLVQKEMDKAHRTGLKILHWNILDVTDGCPKSRHRPDLPKLPIYVNEPLLEAVSKEELDKMPIEARAGYVEERGFAGCIKNCKMFAACKGILATKVCEIEERGKEAREHMMVKSPENTQSAFGRTELSMAKAQLLCWAPTSEGLVYPSFSRKSHVLLPWEIASFFGLPLQEGATKKDLINLLRRVDAEPIVGIDWGFTHPWAAILGWKIGAKMCVTDCISQSGLETSEQLSQFQTLFGEYNPRVYADPENPQNNASFKRAGIRVVDWKKGAGSVKGGIEVVRRKLRPTMSGEPDLVFLSSMGSDKKMEALFDSIASYHYATDANGNLTDEPDDDGDDEVDALRYLVMNAFSKEGKIGLTNSQRAGADGVEQPMHPKLVEILSAAGQLDELQEGNEKPLPLSLRRGKIQVEF